MRLTNTLYIGFGSDTSSKTRELKDRKSISNYIKEYKVKNQRVLNTINSEYKFFEFPFDYYEKDLTYKLNKILNIIVNKTELNEEENRISDELIQICSEMFGINNI